MLIALSYNYRFSFTHIYLWVQQRRDDGKIWISTNWVYEDECYEPSGFIEKAFYDILSDALSKMTGEDHKLH